jgi:hypothetical protein
VEGAHWVLKEYLESPAIDLLELNLLIKYEKLLEIIIIYNNNNKG